MAPLRRAGRGRLPDGGLVMWSVAEGRHGRRWRWTVSDGPANEPRLRHAGLIEVDPAARFVRLELETPRGMLTLHPDGARPLAHGNVVSVDGVRPIEVAWAAGDAVGLEADAFGSTIGGWRGRGLAVAASLEIGRFDPRSGRDSLTTLSVDERGVPVLGGAIEWPLEV
ncbi:MAG: hypothetical protein H0U58_06520 [Chloroflexi bacterium]|nr:hypothetical protein [Chloroflexota bacterium]